MARSVQQPRAPAKRRPRRSPPLVPDDAELKATEVAYLEIKRRIHRGELAPGESYMQGELAGLVGLSRTPTREALIQLCCERHVEFRPRHGVVIRQLTLEELRCLLETLATLEAHAIRCAAERGLEPALLESLVRMQAEMEAALARRDLGRWAVTDEAFHKALVGAGGNAELARLVAAIWDRLPRLWLRIKSLRPMPTASNRDHAALMRALRRRDAERAFKLHWRHHLRAGRTILAILDDNELTAI